MSDNDSIASTDSLAAPRFTPYMPFTSGHVVRDENLIALGEEMVGHVVGPMPTQDFLDFLPCNPAKAPLFMQTSFAKLEKQRTEPEMYDVFVEAMAAFCPNLVGIDTSSKPMKTFWKNVKPDITYYNSSRSDVMESDIESAELMVEVKLSDQNDPFNNPPDDKGLLRDGERARQTLGQVTHYATAHLAAQFRTHVFSVLLFTKSARLMRWDRAGLIVSEPILLDKPELAEFFWRFSNANAKDRGHDPTVTPFKFTQNLTKEFLFEQLQFAADPSDVKVEDVNFFEVSLPRTNNRYVIGKATYLGLSPLPSRGTRSFKAWCLTTKKPVFLKDTWRILSASQRPEHDIYKKLANAKVQHIATMLDYSDIEDHLTQTGKYARKSWVCKIQLKPFHTLQHYRLVLQEIGRSLTSFKDIREVLAALRDALQAHRESYDKGRVLHRDISVGNIILYNGGGLLIDWDMCKDLDWATDRKSISLIAGTWAFQSLRLQKKPKGDQPQVVQDRLDDLESFYHVLFWVSLQHARHERGPVQLYYDITKLFYDASLEKSCHMQSTMVLDWAPFQNPPLHHLLLQISARFRYLYVAPPRPKKRRRDSDSLAELRQQAEEWSLQIHNKQLNFLNSDENSNWMEIEFDEALQHSTDTWGPTGYILNKMTPPPTVHRTKRLYSDMTSSRIGYSDGGTFLRSDQILERGKDENASENEDVDHEPGPQ